MDKGFICMLELMNRLRVYTKYVEILFILLVLYKQGFT